ncbi:small acid-soluble spore protein SspI [Paenibacillus sp. y28]|uniref:small acid-soluble spore protein SspI n=1 Tax=Paenibacillus sp. y28 TaxID=3129110 RepID=UPI00301876AE
MKLDLRQAIVARVSGKSNEDLHDIIADSIDNEERVLPGLGVLFEIIWKYSEETTQNMLVTTLKEHLPSKS